MIVTKPNGPAELSWLTVMLVMLAITLTVLMLRAAVLGMLQTA